MQRFWKYYFDHVLFWIVTVGFHVYTRLYLIPKAGFGQFLFEIILRNGLLAFIIYVNLLWLIPFFLQKQKVTLYLGSVIALLLAYSVLKNFHDEYLFSRFPFNKGVQSSLANIFYNFSIGLFYLAFSVGLYLSKEWYFQRQRLQQIELEKVNTELAFLKNQINPHFLFNSLNTVYFQIDKSNSQARDTLMKFSEMLRFQLYECNGKEIPLEKEIHYLKNYVDIQRIRKDENYQISFSAPKDLKDTTIAPLLLIPFIENAFKHSSHHSDRLNEINIVIKLAEHSFTMSVKNTKEKIPHESLTSGIGMKNVRRRLELQYPGQHSLTVNESEDRYEVELSLQLNNMNYEA